MDFSDLSSEYIGILYEGLLDYELKTAPPDDPVVFLAAGDQPALPLSRLEAMDDRALRALFENLKDRSTSGRIPMKRTESVDSRDPEAGDPQGASPTQRCKASRMRTRSTTWTHPPRPIRCLDASARRRTTRQYRLRAQSCGPQARSAGVPASSARLRGKQTPERRPRLPEEDSPRGLGN